MFADMTLFIFTYAGRSPVFRDTWLEHLPSQLSVFSTKDHAATPKAVVRVECRQYKFKQLRINVHFCDIRGHNIRSAGDHMPGHTRRRGWRGRTAAGALHQRRAGRRASVRPKHPRRDVLAHDAARCIVRARLASLEQLPRPRQPPLCGTHAAPRGRAADGDSQPSHTGATPRVCLVAVEAASAPRVPQHGGAGPCEPRGTRGGHGPVVHEAPAEEPAPRLAGPGAAARGHHPPAGGLRAY